MMTGWRCWLFFTGLSLAGCAVEFPRPAIESSGMHAAALENGSDPDGNSQSGQASNEDGLSGDALFARTFNAHGGSRLSQLQDLNVALDGRWKFLITRIQPLVTDHRYRVRSEERISPQLGVYAAFYRGPAGTKQVFRSPGEIRVWYDGIETDDPDVLASTALTADSFQLFSLGALSPIARVDAGSQIPNGENGYRRLPDVEEAGRRYHRIYRRLVPGLGLSKADELVIWIDAQSYLTYRIGITLEGYRTTQGAHVDVTFLEYAERAGVVLPVVFNERVRGPIAISAHRWWLTGLDLNRGWSAEALTSAPWAPSTARAADPLQTLGSSGDDSLPKR